MPVTASSPAPYTSARAITALIERHRERGLPTPISEDVLRRSGITDSLVPRTLASLVTLDLIDDKGAPTSTFEGLRCAPAAEYPERLAQWLNHVYADVLKFIDPATADDEELEDAFRIYNPSGQRPRIISLFTGLYSAAGVRSQNASSRRQSRVTNNAGTNGDSARQIRKKLIQQAAYAPVPSAPSSSVAPPLASSPTSGPLGSNPYRMAYEALSAVWAPGEMGDDVDAAVVTLLRYLRKRETEPKA